MSAKQQRDTYLLIEKHWIVV